MTRLLRTALVIARRDYVATVFSRSFLLFLIGPLFPLLFGLGLGALAADGERAAPARPVVVAMLAPADAAPLAAAVARLEARLGRDRMPAFHVVPPADRSRAAIRRLIGHGGRRAVLLGGLDRPALFAPPALLADTAGPVALAIDLARGRQAPPVALARHRIALPKAAARDAQVDIARGGQLVLVMLVLLLSGMLVSNLVEEKSNKVIEVLAAAAPVDAIFAGKLAAMLAMALTGIAAWGGAAAIVGLALWPAQVAALAAPAVGWGTWALLGLVYFAMSYLLIGGLLLGIGAQAATVREVQTLSMPLTMGQLLIVAFAAAGIGRADGWIAWAAAIVPWSSPFAMLARAAERPGLVPHLAAIGWQALWVAIVVRVAARLFRRSVLSGGPGPLKLPWRRPNLSA